MGNAFGFGAASPMVAPDTVVTHEGFMSRMGKACYGMCFGFILFVLALVLLGWNEFNYVRNEQILEFVAETAVEAGCDGPDATDNKPVHVSCPVASVWDFGADARVGPDLPQLFGGEQKALNTLWISAKSEIYQWVEDKNCDKKSDGAGGKTESCKYTYNLEWTDKPIDSHQFGCLTIGIDCVDSSGKLVNPTNRGTIPSLLDGELVAPDDDVAIGTYGLNSDLVLQLTASYALQPSRPNSLYVPSLVPDKPWATPTATRDGYGFVFTDGQSVGRRNQVGDVRSSFKKSSIDLGDTVSTVAFQTRAPGAKVDKRLRPWSTGKPGTMGHVNWAFQGHVSLQEMVNRKASENSSATMLLRLAGWLLTFLGLQLLTGPIALAPELLPCVGTFLGEVVGCALCCVNFAVSLSISLVVIGLAWVAARPVVGITLLCFALGVFVVASCAKRRFKSARSPGLISHEHPPMAGAAAGVPAPSAPPAPGR